MAAAHSNGTILKYKASSGGSYAAMVCEVVSITPQPGTVTKSPRGHLGSTNALHITEPGARQPGQMQIQLRCETVTDTQWDEYQAFKGYWLARTNPLYFQINAPKASVDTTAPLSEFTGYLASEPCLTFPEDGTTDWTLDIEITSEITLTDAA